MRNADDTGYAHDATNGYMYANTSLSYLKPVRRFLVILSVWYGLVWLGTAGYGWVWLGMAGYGWVWLGMVGYGWVWLGMVGYGWVWLESYFQALFIGTPYIAL